MITLAQILLIVVSIIFVVYIITLISRRRLLLRYSLLWIALSVILVFCAIFPEPIYRLSSFFGFELASNFIFLVAILFLLAISLSLSVIASRQTAYIKSLVQEVALLRLDKTKESDDQEPRA